MKSWGLSISWAQLLLEAMGVPTCTPTHMPLTQQSTYCRESRTRRRDPAPWKASVHSGLESWPWQPLVSVPHLEDRAINTASFKGAPAPRKSSRDGATSSSPEAICQLRQVSSDHLSNLLVFHMNTSKSRGEKFSQAKQAARIRISLHPGSFPSPRTSVLGFSSPHPAKL